jgi:hypothetical protein
MKLYEKKYGSDYWNSDIRIVPGANESKIRRGLKRGLAKARRQEGKALVKRKEVVDGE